MSSYLTLCKPNLHYEQKRIYNLHIFHCNEPTSPNELPAWTSQILPLSSHSFHRFKKNSLPPDGDGIHHLHHLPFSQLSAITAYIAQENMKVEELKTRYDKEWEENSMRGIKEYNEKLKLWSEEEKERKKRKEKEWAARCKKKLEGKGEEEGAVGKGGETEKEKEGQKEGERDRDSGSDSYDNDLSDCVYTPYHYEEYSSDDSQCRYGLEAQRSTRRWYGGPRRARGGRPPPPSPYQKKFHYRPRPMPKRPATVINKMPFETLWTIEAVQMDLVPNTVEFAAGNHRTVKVHEMLLSERAKQSFALVLSRLTASPLLGPPPPRAMESRYYSPVRGSRNNNRDRYETLSVDFSDEEEDDGMASASLYYPAPPAPRKSKAQVQKKAELADEEKEKEKGGGSEAEEAAPATKVTENKQDAEDMESSITELEIGFVSADFESV